MQNAAIGQRISSAGTCLRQVPAIYKLLKDHLTSPEIFFAATKEILDYGGGKYDLLTEKFAELKIRNMIYDPFNRSEDHNALVRKMLSIRPADHAICSNVLNVIKEPAARQAVLRDIASMLAEDGTLFITLYEGNRSSKGRKTSRGWQANRPLKSYVREVRKVFKSGYFFAGGKVLMVQGKGYLRASPSEN